jgi:peptidoglycan LD-endopeptidase CwlK
MPAFSDRSRARLATCHPLIIKVFTEAIVHGPDFTIICGERPVREQQELFAQGRTKPGSIVTNVDGITKLSKHNKSPSEAVDVAPYPSLYEDIPRFKILGAYIMGVAHAMDVPLVWGADWDSDWDLAEHEHVFVDLPHFELRL